MYLKSSFFKAKAALNNLKTLNSCSCEEEEREGGEKVILSLSLSLREKYL